MTWEKEERIMKKTAEDIAKHLVGKTIAAVDMDLFYPGLFDHIKITTTTGECITLSIPDHAGCNQCDPEGIGSGVEVDFSVNPAKEQDTAKPTRMPLSEDGWPTAEEGEVNTTTCQLIHVSRRLKVNYRVGDPVNSPLGTGCITWLNESTGNCLIKLDR